MSEEQSLGGNLNDAVRVGDTVRRRTGPWTPAVHALLRFLEKEGFDAPRVIGMDERGREVLQFMEGEAYAGNPVPLPDHIFREDHLVGAARLLRRYHDTIARFDPPAGATWRLVGPSPHEIICHNDWSPWNALFRDGRIAAFLDWDLAGPGPRLFDVANAAYSWTPLISGATVIPDIGERARRLRLFCDEYGLEDRTGILAAMRERLTYVANFIDEQARSGDPGMMKLVGWDTPHKMLVDDAGYLNMYRTLLRRALS